MEGNESEEENIEENENIEKEESPDLVDTAVQEVVEDASPVEEEPSPKPEPPDETTNIVIQLQQLVTLPRLKSVIWSEESSNTLRRFVLDPSEESLIISLDAKAEQLIVATGYLVKPVHAVSSVVFFRHAPQPLKADSIHKQLGHFSVPGQADEASLLVLESAFAQPFVFSNSSWPLSVKTRACGLLHELFSELNRQHHASEGLSALYVPKEGLDSETENTVVLLGRLEEAVARWSEQVSSAVHEELQTTKLPLITDMIHFSCKKYKNLCYLEKQLTGEAMQKILPILDIAQSDGGRQLRAIIAQASRGKDEAVSNMSFLEALSEPCRILSESTDLSNLTQHIVKIISIIRIIWLRSPYFNTRVRVMQLFLGLSHHIIEVCKQSITMRWIFKGRAIYCIERANECIECCVHYMSVYEEIAELHRKHTEYKWDINTQEIFSSVYTFMGRCKDLKEICEAMQIFGRMNEKKEILKPMFAGPNGRHFEDICEAVMKDTRSHIDNISKHQNIALDVTCTSWLEEMDKDSTERAKSLDALQSILLLMIENAIAMTKVLGHIHFNKILCCARPFDISMEPLPRFRQKMVQIERRVEALIHTVLNRATTVDEGLQAMSSLFHYLQKPSFKSLFVEKSNMVYKMLSERIEAVSQSMLGGEPVGYSDLPPYSGAALMAHLNRTHLLRQINMLNEANCLSDCEQKEKTTQELAFLVSVIEDTMQEYYDQWAGGLSSDWEARLRRPLIGQSPTNPGMIEPTLNRDIIVAMNEAQLWKKLGYSTPAHMQDLCEREKTITDMYENILAISKEYNEAIASLSDSERCLFKDIIVKIDRNMKAAFSHYSWISKIPNEFILRCFKNTEELHQLTSQFHDDIEAIYIACSRMGDLTLLEVRAGYLYKVEELKENMRKAVKPHYQEILQILGRIKPRFKKITPNISKHWVKFVTAVNTLIEETIVMLVRSSLQSFSSAMIETLERQPLIQVTASIKNSMVTFEPPMQEIANTVYNTLECIRVHTNWIPGLLHKLNMAPAQKLSSVSAKIISDPKCKELQVKLNKEMDSCLELLKSYAQSWEAYSWLWTIDQEHLLSRYSNQSLAAISIVHDIERLSVLLEETSIDTICNISFLEVNGSTVKDTIAHHVQKWQNALLGLLLESTLEKAHKFHLDLETDMKKLLQDSSSLQDVAEKTVLCHIAMGHIPSKESQMKVIMEQSTLLAQYKVSLPDEESKLIDSTPERWQAYLSAVEVARSMLETSKEHFRATLIDNGNSLNRDLNKLQSEIHNNGPFNPSWEEEDALEYLSRTMQNICLIKEKREELARDFEMFGLDPPQLSDLAQLRRVVEVLTSIWELRKEWAKCWNKFKNCKFSALDTSELQAQTKTLSRKLNWLSREPAREWPVLEYTRSEVENVKHALPLIQLLRNEALRQRHWERIQASLDSTFDPQSDEFVLEMALSLGITNCEEDIKAISNEATVEFKIEQGLKQMTAAWGTIKIEAKATKGSAKVKRKLRIGSLEKIYLALDKHLGELSVMEASKSVKPFSAEVNNLRRNLFILLEGLELINYVQDLWLKIEPTFLDENMKDQLKSPVVDEVYKEWQAVIKYLQSEPNLLQAVCNEGFIDRLKDLKNHLGLAYEDLEEFLDKIRNLFPRLFFLPSRELVETMSNTENFAVMQVALARCFPGIQKFHLGRQPMEVRGLTTYNGEALIFSEPIFLHGTVDQWMSTIEQAMKETLHEQLTQSYESLNRNCNKRERWIRSWTSQVSVLVSQIWWTEECSKILQKCARKGSRKPLKLFREEQELTVNKFCELVGGDISVIERQKLAAVLATEIHARDVMEKLYKAGCKDISSFDWLSQLRFYWDDGRKMFEVRQMFGLFQYGCEFYGDPGQLVITPVIDRCILSLTTALHLKTAPLIHGPQGCGKTETIQGLAKMLGRMIMLIHCNYGMTFKGFALFLCGIAQTGAWGLFDKFLSMKSDVLSVGSRDVNLFLSAMSADQDSLTIQGREIKLIHTSALFVSMTSDDSGCTKGKKIPASVRSLFRVVALNQPDSCLVVEMTLLGEGFSDSLLFAQKICRLFYLSKTHLSPQKYYNFSHGKMVELARYAGAKKKILPRVPDEEVLLYTIQTITASKLTPEDKKIFQGFLYDLFPGVEAPTVDQVHLTETVHGTLRDAGLQPLALSIRKVLQLHQALVANHAVMLVGHTGSGKSTAWKTLSDSLCDLADRRVPGFEMVQVHPFYPNALNYQELYGEYGKIDRKWKDGFLSSKIRILSAENSLQQKWILLDGAVHPSWSDYLMGLLDKNILNLDNGETIFVPEKLKILFEVEDLNATTPSILPHCACIHFEQKELGWQPFKDSWLQKLETGTIKDEICRLFSVHLDNILKFKKQNCQEKVQASELSSIQTLCKMMESLIRSSESGLSNCKNDGDLCVLIKQWFFFSLVWGIFGTVDGESRDLVDAFLREMEMGMFPAEGTVFDCCVDPLWGGFVLWSEKMPSKWTYDPSVPFYKMLVPSIDVTRYSFVIKTLIDNGSPVLLTGSIGSGKSIAAHNVLKNLDSEKYSTFTMNLTAETTTHRALKMLRSHLEKRSSGVLVPPRGKILTVFLDDFNLPKRDSSGSQPPLEIVRQWVEHSFWFDPEENCAHVTKNLQLLAAMSHRGRSHLVSRRLLSHFSLINIELPSDKELHQIFGCMLTQHLLGFGEQIKILGKELTQASIQLFKNIKNHLLPTPISSYYLFSIRDLTKVFQGLLMCHRDHHNTRSAMCRLWVHENYRVYCDRISSMSDKEWFIDEISEQSFQQFGLPMEILCPGNRLPIFGQLKRTDEEGQPYIEMTFDDAREKLDVIIEELNSKTPQFGQILFKDAIDHIARMVRVLSQPYSHLLLLGEAGCGRHSLVKAAAYICKMNVVNAAVKNKLGEDDFRFLIKEVIYQTGIVGQATAFILSDTQIVMESYLDIINGIIRTGEVHNLFESKELEKVLQELTHIIDDDEIAEHCSYPSPEQLLAFLAQRVKHNLHIVLCFNPNETIFRKRLQNFPALSTCTMDWIQEWPEDALVEVAKKYTTNLNLGDIKMEARTQLCNVFAKIHEFAKHITHRTLLENNNAITTVHYLDFVKVYCLLLTNKQTDLKTRVDKLKMGLDKIDETRQKVEGMSDELLQAQRKVLDSQRQCDSALVLLGQHRREAEEQERWMVTRANQLAQEESTTQQLARLAHAAMDEALPCLEEADSALDMLDHKDLMDMRAFGRPPDLVELVMFSLLILKQGDPTWVEAKRQLADTSFIAQLRNFDKDHISDKTLKSISTYTNNPEFNPDKIGSISVAARFLCMWVLAIEKYGKIYRVAAPKRAKLDRATRELREHQAELADSQTKLAQLNSQLEEQKVEYEKRLQIRDVLHHQAEELGANLLRANQLVSGLGGEEKQWQPCVKGFDAMSQLLVGDCLLTSALLSYAGAFPLDVRQEFQLRCIQHVEDAKIAYSTSFYLPRFLVDSTTVQEWKVLGLPDDPYTENSSVLALQQTLVVHSGLGPPSRWPLLVDPQGLALTWLKSVKEFENIRVIDQEQDNFISVLEDAVENGFPLVIQKVKDSLDPVLIPLLNKEFIEIDGLPSIRLNGKIIVCHIKFRLFFSTEMKNFNSGPKLTSKVNIINFAPQIEGLQKKLLRIVVENKEAKLEEQRKELLQNTISGERNLTQLEDEVLRLLIETQTSILDDSDLMSTLEVNKSSTILETENILCYANDTEINQSLQMSFHPCAERAAILFSVLEQLEKLDPMYHFSLENYVALFENSVVNSPICSVHTDQIEAINSHHTSHFYQKISRSLFERHRPSFSLFIATRLITDEDLFPKSKLHFLMKKTFSGYEKIESRNPCKAWLNDKKWNLIIELEETFSDFLGITEHIEEYSNEWCSWYKKSKPELESLIGKWNELVGFNRLLLISTFRPDRICSNLSKFVADLMGQQFNEPLELDLPSLLETSDPGRPILLLPSSGIDLTGAIHQLAKSCGLGDQLHIIPSGRGIENSIAETIEKSAEIGHWVYLADCHLITEWLTQLDRILTNLKSTKLHPLFRIWLSSQSHPNFPISITQFSDKMSVERSKGVKPTMKRLMTQMPESSVLNHRKLVFNLGLMHAMLLQRTLYHRIGWSHQYEFNDMDVLMFWKILSANMEEHPEKPSESLRYFLADIIYNSRILNKWDHRLFRVFSFRILSQLALDEPGLRLSDSVDNEFDDMVREIPRTVPQQLSVTSLLQKVDTDDAKLCGLHFNAKLPSLLAKSHSILRDIRSLVYFDHQQGRNKETKVLQVCTYILENLPQLLTMENHEGATSEISPLDGVLEQEKSFYNLLLDTVKSDVQELERALQGHVPMAEELLPLFYSVHENFVPLSWDAVASNNEEHLLTWIKNFQYKISLITEWSMCKAPLHTINLAAVSLPSAFLSAVMRSSCNHLSELDEITWTFTVAKLGENFEGLQNVQDGIVVQGLALEGAAWDSENECLIESLPLQMSHPMPDVLFKPTHHQGPAYLDYFDCPCYCDKSRTNFLLSIPLNPGSLSTDHWCLRGTALILQI